MAGISWIASRSFAMTGVVIASGSEAIQLVVKKRLDCRVASLLAMTVGDPELFASL
jgi:hypothetical protein